jgi:amino acid transporter
MLKFLLLELVKAYTKKLIMPRERKKQYSNYFIAFFCVVGLILLLIADYIYLYSIEDYTSSVSVLLIISTAFFLLALAIKLISLWLNRKELEDEEVLDTGGVVSLVKDLMPIIVSMVPVGIIVYIIWAKIQVKVFGKKLDLKTVVRRLF